MGGEELKRGAVGCMGGRDGGVIGSWVIVGGILGASKPGLLLAGSGTVWVIRGTEEVG